MTPPSREEVLHPFLFKEGIMGWLFFEAVMKNPDSWQLGLAPTSNRLYCAVRASPNQHLFSLPLKGVFRRNGPARLMSGGGCNRSGLHNLERE